MDEAHFAVAKLRRYTPAEAKILKMEECGDRVVTRNPAEMGKLLKSVLK